MYLTKTLSRVAVWNCCSESLVKIDVQNRCPESLVKIDVQSRCLKQLTRIVVQSRCPEPLSIVATQNRCSESLVKIDVQKSLIKFNVQNRCPTSSFRICLDQISIDFVDFVSICEQELFVCLIDLCAVNLIAQNEIVFQIYRACVMSN